MSGYEQADEYPLTQIVSKDVPFSWRVTKMRLKGTSVIVNESLTLSGVPRKRLPTNSATGARWNGCWTSTRSARTSAAGSSPTRTGRTTGEYIARLVRKVVTVSVETARIVASLPPVILEPESAAPNDGTPPAEK